MKIVNVINQKGGVGKTSLSVNLALGLAKQGHKVLLVDGDSQGNATLYFSPDSNKINLEDINSMEYIKGKSPLNSLSELLGSITFPYDINDVILEKIDSIRDAIYTTTYEGLDIIPSTDTALINTDQTIKLENKLQHNRLKKALKEIRHDYDYVIIDNAPTFNTITINTLFCSDEIIIPIKIGKSELAGFIETMRQLEKLMINYECEYEVKILLNMIPRGNRPKYVQFISKMHQLFDDYNSVFKTTVFEQTIGYQEAVATNSSMTNKLIIENSSNVSKDYQNLIDEISGN